MADTVVLHIGLMKSGTTFLQGRMNANRDALLAEQGVLFPGPTWRRHSRAVTDLVSNGAAATGAWPGLVDEVAAHPGTAVVSMEYLGPMAEDRIRTACSSFGDAEVRVVLTVRDLGRTVPAMWQEAVKNGRTWSWPDYVRSVQKGGEPGRRFWRQQDAAAVASRWAAAAGADHVHVVTVPPPGAAPEVLWQRFCSAATIEAEGTWAEAPRSNESLGVASVALVSRLNEVLADFSKDEHKAKVKGLAKHVLAQRRRDERAIGFDVPRWLRRRHDQMVAELADLGVTVVGDLAELEPVDVPGVDPSTVTPDEVAETATAALAGLLRAGGAVTPAVGRASRPG